MVLTLEVSFQVLVDFWYDLLTSNSQRMLFLYKNQPDMYQFEDEIQSMEQQGIISKFDRNTATEWLNLFIIVKTCNGDLRICLDPTDLNKDIVRHSGWDKI